MHGCCTSNGAPSISHMLFVDDSLLFFIASKQKCCKVHSILREYEKIGLGSQLSEVRNLFHQ